MSKAEETVLVIKGAISELPAERKAIVVRYYEIIEAWVSANPAEAMLAVALVGAEIDATQPTT